MSAIAPTIIAPWSSAPMRPLDMPQDPLIYPVAFDHFTPEKNHALSHLYISTIALEKGCPFQCAGCAERAMLPDLSKTMEFERLRSLAAGIANINRAHKAHFEDVIVAPFQDSEPTLYRSLDQHGQMVNIYHASEALYMASGIRTLITTTGGTVGDNIMYGAMQMIMGNLGKETSPVALVGYSLKTISIMAQQEIDVFIDRCLKFLFTATDEEISTQYKNDAAKAFVVRRRFRDQWQKNPNSLKNNLDKINGDSAWTQFKSSLMFGPEPLAYKWIFMPFIEELFEMNFFKHTAEYLNFLKESAVANGASEKVATYVNYLNIHQAHSTRNGLRQFEFFFSEDFMCRLKESINPINPKMIPLGGAGRSIEDFDLSRQPTVNIEGVFPQLHNNGRFKIPNMYLVISSDGTLNITVAQRPTSCDKRILTAKDFLASARWKKGKEKELCEIFASLAGRNVFPDLDGMRP